MQQYYGEQSISQPRKKDDIKYTQQQRFRRSPTQQTTAKNKQYHHRMSSSSEDGATINDSNKNKWQEVKNKKKRKTNQPDSQNITLTNGYSQVTVEEDGNISIQATENKIQKPPSIFVYGVENYQEMIHNLQSIVEIEKYTTKTLADNTIRINSHTLDTYHKLVRYVLEKNIITSHISTERKSSLQGSH
jgi:hypothetical protein